MRRQLNTSHIYFKLRAEEGGEFFDGIPGLDAGQPTTEGEGLCCDLRLQIRLHADAIVLRLDSEAWKSCD